MKALTILQYQWKDLVRGKWIFGYALIYLLIADALIRFGGEGAKVLLSISNVMLLLIPLVGMIYGALYLYQSREFIELLLAQPLDRITLFWGLYGGIAAPLALAFSLGTSIPILYGGVLATVSVSSVLLLLGLGTILTLLFTGIGFWIGLSFFEEKIKGFGVALVGWLSLAIIYDGLVLLTIFIMGDYAIEKPMLIMTMLNPIDLARISVLIEFDISALMGYTGAVFNRFFGSMMGAWVAAASLFMWTITPLFLGLQKFKRMDF